jgi:hypothetical protein
MIHPWYGIFLLEGTSEHIFGDLGLIVRYSLGQCN